MSCKALPDLQEKLAECDVLALGPGLGHGESAVRLVHTLLDETSKPIVLDADGINALEGHIDSLDGRRGRVTILTPHDGEFLRIGGELSHGGPRASSQRVCYKTWLYFWCSRAIGL